MFGESGKDILHGVVLGLVAVIGGFVYGFLGPMLPSFNYSGIVYAVVGLVLAAFGFHLACGQGFKAYAGAFMVGIGLVMASGLIAAVKGLLPSNSGA